MMLRFLRWLAAACGREFHHWYRSSAEIELAGMTLAIAGMTDGVEKLDWIRAVSLLKSIHDDCVRTLNKHEIGSRPTSTI